MSTIITTLPLGTARRRLLATLLLSLALTACGGGSAEQPSLPAEPVTPDSTAIDGGQTAVGAEQPVDELVNTTPDDSSSAVGGQAAAGDPSSAGGGPAMPGGGTDTGNTVAEEVAQLPVGDSGVDDVSSPVIDAVPQHPTDIVEDAPAAGEVVAGEPGDVDQLFGDDDDQAASIDDGQSTVVVDDASSDAGEELVTDSDDLPLVNDQSQSEVADGVVTDDGLIAEQQQLVEASAGDLDGLFGDGSELMSTQAVQNQPSLRELRWVLPSQRVDGSRLSRQEVKAIELWGGFTNHQLRKWATLAPTTQYYNLSSAPRGLYRFALVTIDQDGLRSDMSGAVIRDLR